MDIVEISIKSNIYLDKIFDEQILEGLLDPKRVGSWKLQLLQELKVYQF